MGKNTDHIVINCMRGGRLECLHCGVIFHLEKVLPLSINMVTAIHKAFRKEHRDCKLDDNGRLLQTTEKQYFEDSKVNFIATRDQLYNFISSAPQCKKTYTREEFETVDLWGLEIEIYPIEDVKDGYYFLRQAFPNFTFYLEKAGIQQIFKDGTSRIID